MNKKDIFKEFINKINDYKLLTKFIINIFDYNEFNDYNYIFRMIDNENDIIIDIYDNVSDNRFNRYIFSFSEKEYSIKIIEEGNVFVNYICVLNVFDSLNKLEKLAYLFKIDKDMMVEYAKTFLDDLFVDILKGIIK